MHASSTRLAGHGRALRARDGASIPRPARGGRAARALLAGLTLCGLALAWALLRAPGPAPSPDPRVAEAARPAPREAARALASSERSPVEPIAARSSRPPSAAPRRERAGPQGPRTEAEHVAELRALARSDPGAFDRRVASILTGGGADCERIASLRVAYEADRPAVTDLCLSAVTSLPLASGPASESVPQALVQWLADRASREPRAREVLAAIAWTRPAEVDSRLRAHAVRALVASAPEADVRLLAIRIRAEGDPDVHSAGQDALDERDRPAPHLEPSQEIR